MIGLGIDAGGTGTRWLLRSAAGELARGGGGPLSGHLYSPASRSAAAETVAALATAALTHARPDRIVAGVTGIDERGTEHAFLRATLASEFGLPQEAVLVMNDIALAYRGAFAPGAGVLLYAGTGSVAYHLAANGSEYRAGGHGYIIDDAGGGYFLGRQALRRIVRDRDEHPGTAARSLLESLVCEQIGGDGWEELRAYVYGGGRSAVAALAPVVAAAATQGDEGAQRILEQAGAELARLARVLLGRLGEQLPIGFSGGVARIGGALERTLRAELPPRTELFAAEAEAEDTAARLALDSDTRSG